MTAAELAPWATPAITIALIAWLRMDLGKRIDRIDQRMDGFDERLRALEVAVSAMAAKLDLLERYFLRPNEPVGEPSPEASE